jgi:hypothetical protein
MTEVKTIEIGEITVENISTDAPKLTNPNDVLFKVKYPKDWKKEKLMPEGVVIVSKETADHFTKIGIGKCS